MLCLYFKQGPTRFCFAVKCQKVITQQAVFSRLRHFFVNQRLAVWRKGGSGITSVLRVCDI